MLKTQAIGKILQHRINTATDIVQKHGLFSLQLLVNELRLQLENSSLEHSPVKQTRKTRPTRTQADAESTLSLTCVRNNVCSVRLRANGPRLPPKERLFRTGERAAQMMKMQPH